MELDEYMEALLDIDITDMSDDELDRIDATVKSVIMQMGWFAKVKVVDR